MDRLGIKTYTHGFTQVYPQQYFLAFFLKCVIILFVKKITFGVIKIITCDFVWLFFYKFCVNVIPMVEILPLWSQCLDDLKYQVSDNEFTMWLRPLQAVMVADELVVKVPNQYFVQKITDDYLSLIQQATDKHANGEVTNVRVVVGNAGVESLVRGSTLEQVTEADLSFSTLQSQAVVDTLQQSAVDIAQMQANSSINPEFTFDTFVTGKSNSFAHKACYEISKRNAKIQHNPLFIYGGSGLGKTHLMHSVAHRYAKANRSFNYFSSDKFINQLVYSLRMKKIDEFKEKIQQVDLLIIDDIHVLAGKTKSTEEFFSLFADFINAGKQLVLASDRHPSQLSEFDDRFRSRLTGGLSVAIEPPELDTRVQILNKKALQVGIDLPKECSLFIAQNIISNVRSLEGALNQVLANANLTGSPITLEMVQYALKDIVVSRVQSVSMETIRKVVAEYYNISVKDIMGKKRLRSIARPRQIAMALSRDLTKESYPDIGQSFGGRDHTTVMHACSKIKELREADPELDKEYNSLFMLLQS